MRLVKGEMVGKIYEMQAGADSAEFLLWHTQQKLVAQRFACGISFSRLNDCKLGESHFSL